MRIIILMLGLVVSSWLTACAPKGPNQVAPAAGTGIIGGTAVADGAPISSSIVAIYDEENDAVCTGSLIASDIVLTAAHCVYELNPDKIKIVYGINVSDVLTKATPEEKQKFSRPVIQFKIHDDYNVDLHEDDPFDWADIAVIQFQGTLPAFYKPAKMVLDMGLIKPGVMATMAGYGVSNVSVYPVNPKKLKNIKELIEEGTVYCEDGRRNCFEVSMSGDGNLRETHAPIAFVVRSEVRMDESKGKGTCSGDSGGPMYLEKDGEKLLFGITSRGSGLCDGVGIYTNAVFYRDWIAKAIAGF